MRPDLPKLRATHKSGAKDQARDLEHRQQLQADSKKGYHEQESGQGHILRRDGDHDRNPVRR